MKIVGPHRMSVEELKASPGVVANLAPAIAMSVTLSNLEGFQIVADDTEICLTYLRFTDANRDFPQLRIDMMETYSFDTPFRLLAGFESVRMALLTAIFNELTDLALDDRITSWDDARQYFLLLGFQPV